MRGELRTGSRWRPIARALCGPRRHCQAAPTPTPATEAMRGCSCLGGSTGAAAVGGGRGRSSQSRVSARSEVGHFCSRDGCSIVAGCGRWLRCSRASTQPRRHCEPSPAPTTGSWGSVIACSAVGSIASAGCGLACASAIRCSGFIRAGATAAFTIVATIAAVLTLRCCRCTVLQCPCRYRQAAPTPTPQYHGHKRCVTSFRRARIRLPRTLRIPDCLLCGAALDCPNGRGPRLRFEFSQ